MRISREHCEIELRNERLYVRCLEAARNPVYRLGEISKEFTVFSGETFRIGLTTFRLDSRTEDQGSDYDFDLDANLAELEMAETEGVDGDVEQLRDEIASLRSQLQADADAKRHEEEKGDEARREVDVLRQQLGELKEELNAAQSEIERMQFESGGKISESKEFKALRADVGALKSKVQSGEFLKVSDDDKTGESGADESPKRSPKGLDALRARLAREADERRERRG